MKTIVGVEILRIIAIVAVVALHAAPLLIDIAPVQFVIDEACRFAVPVFFVISGYLLSERYFTDTLPSLWKLFIKLAAPYLAWLAIYTLIAMSGLVPEIRFTRSLLAILSWPISGGAAFHLWFLPALFVGTVIAVYAIKLVGRVPALVLGLALNAAGVALAIHISSSENLPSFLYRNGLFLAPLYVAGGYALKDVRMTTTVALGIAALGFCIQLLEGYFLFGTYPAGHEMSLGTIPFTVGIFLAALNIGAMPDRVVELGRDVFGAYLVHVLVLALYVLVLPQANMFNYVACLATVVGLSMLISRLAKQNGLLRKIV